MDLLCIICYCGINILISLCCYKSRYNNVK